MFKIASYGTCFFKLNKRIKVLIYKLFLINNIVVHICNLNRQENSLDAIILILQREHTIYVKKRKSQPNC